MNKIFFALLLAVAIPALLYGQSKQAPAWEAELGAFELDSGVRIQLYGVFAGKDKQALDKLLQENSGRIRSAILSVLRNTDVKSLTDPKMPFLPAVLQKLNPILENRLSEIIVTDISLSAGQKLAPLPKPAVVSETKKQMFIVQDAEKTRQLMTLGLNGLRAVNERIRTLKNEKTLIFLLDIAPTAENLFFPLADPDYIELFSETADSWDDIPTKQPPYKQKGTGYLIIRFFADYKYGPPSSPYRAPQGCYVTHRVLKIANSEARIEISTRTSDPHAGAKLARIVEEEFSRLGTKFVR